MNSHCGPGAPGHTYTSIDRRSTYIYVDKNWSSVLGTLLATVHVCEMLEHSLVQIWLISTKSYSQANSRKLAVIDSSFI